MELSSNYEIVEIADELLAIPVGEKAKECRDVFTFSKAGAFLLKKMKKSIHIQELVDLLLEEYQLDVQTATLDVEQFIASLIDAGIIVQ